MLAEVKDLMDLVPLLVALEGTAWTESPVECELTSRPAIISQACLLAHCRPCQPVRVHRLMRCKGGTLCQLAAQHA